MSAELARELVLRYGTNSTSYQILNSGIDHWFGRSRGAVVGYTRRQNTLLAAGAPICDPGELKYACAEFEEFASSQGCDVCYVCAEERLRRVLEGDGGHARIALGSQPEWEPARWPSVVARHSSLRAQLSRSRNKRVGVEVVPSESAARSQEIRAVLSEWIEHRALPPLHFLVEPEILDSVMADRVVLVASRRGRAVAFLVASPVPRKNGYLVELLARSSDAPNGTSELLIDAAMRHFALAGCDYVSLGLVALARAADRQMAENPPWLAPLMRFARAHANRFYNFRGLEQFRSKMEPDRWGAVYAISNERRFSPATLYALGGAFSGISPMLAIGLGAVNALRQEGARLFAPLRHRHP